MQNLLQFIQEHIDDDLTRLVLKKSQWPDIDVVLAVDCIASRRKLKSKVSIWAENFNLICPFPLSAEQCSSDETAAYKASLAQKIAQKSGQDKWKIADLTGGLGVDSWYFSKLADKVLYNEMQPLLSQSAEHNFKALAADNVVVKNFALAPYRRIDEIPESQGRTVSQILGDFHPDIIFLDPARRGQGGRKVFLLEDCTPDVLGLMDELWECTENILLKLSPMADITMLVDRLGVCVREVHIVSVGGECKELLLWLDKNKSSDGYELHIYESGAKFVCCDSDEKNARPIFATKDILSGPMNLYFLFEPGKSVMKAGLFNYMSEHFQIMSLGRSTHYYLVPVDISEDLKNELSGLGKIMKIREVQTMNKSTLKMLSARYPHCEVTARNLPLSSDELRKKMKVSSGNDAHLYALKTDALANLIFVC